MKKLLSLKDWKERLKKAATPEYILPTTMAVLLLALSLLINYVAGTYAATHISASVQDIFLSNVPIVNVTYVFVWGTIGALVAISVFLLIRFEDIPYVVKSIALLVLIRSAFIALTHLAPYTAASQIVENSYIVGKISFGGDLFFSGHTAVPFLLALIYWNQKTLRYVFLIGSVVFAAIVLLGHIHYSIDVAAAYFITYSIYRITKKFFADDYRLFMARIGGQAR